MTRPEDVPRLLRARDDVRQAIAKEEAAYADFKKHSPAGLFRLGNGLNVYSERLALIEKRRSEINLMQIELQSRLNTCQRVTGTVESESPVIEQDGDVHFDLAVSASYRRLLSSGNLAAQHGWLVVELTPRDGGHLPKPAVGDRVALVGAWVNDTQHSWHEIHPVFSESINGGPAHTSGPQYGGSRPSDRSADADADCRTPSGARCVGY